MTRRSILKSLFLLGFCAGCSDYPTISPSAYQYAKALYSLTNRRQTEKLDRVSDLILKSQQAGDLTEEEVEWLKSIIDDARRGQWQAAQQEARQMMSDQVE